MADLVWGMAYYCGVGMALMAAFTVVAIVLAAVADLVQWLRGRDWRW